MSAAPPRRFTRLAVAVVIAALVISASALTYSSLEATVTRTVATSANNCGPFGCDESSTTTTGSVPYQPCSSFVWNTSSPTPYDEHTPVLLMSPDTTAYVCVIYQTAWQGNQALYNSDASYNSNYAIVNGTYTFYPFIVANYQGCGGISSGASCRQIIYESFKVGAVPASVMPSGALDYLAVVYSITAPSNSTGFYDQSAPWTGCTGMPMAVGYSASQVNASDFAPPPAAECPVQLFLPVAEYVTGMSVTYIDLPPNLTA